jgi:hypothetical protein
LKVVVYKLGGTVVEAFGRYGQIVDRVTKGLHELLRWDNSCGRHANPLRPCPRALKVLQSL